MNSDSIYKTLTHKSEIVCWNEDFPVSNSIPLGFKHDVIFEDAGG